jgi:hypothetical protein
MFAHHELYHCLGANSQLSGVGILLEPAMPTTGADTSGSSAPSRWRTRPPRWVLSAAGVLAAGVVAVAALTAAAYRRSVVLHAGLQPSADVLAILASRSARVVTLRGLQGATMWLVYDPVRGRGALVVVRLDDPREGLTYRLWLTDGGPPRPVATFVPASGRLTLLSVQADFSRARTVAVEAGPVGRAGWRGAPVVQAQLASSERRWRPPRSSPPLPRQ